MKGRPLWHDILAAVAAALAAAVAAHLAGPTPLVEPAAAVAGAARLAVARFGLY